MQLQPKLAHVYPDGAILEGAVIGRFPHHRMADFLLSQVLGQIGCRERKRLLSKIKQKVTKAGGFLKGGACGNALDELPTLVQDQLFLMRQPLS